MEALSEMRVVPDVLLGDFDSLPPQKLATAIEIVPELSTYPTEKDQTDSELAVAYALVVGVGIYREISFRKLYKILLEAAITSGVIGILVGIASVFAWVMAAQKIPETILQGMLSLSTSPLVFLVLSAVIFLIIGSFLEGLPAIVVLLPTMFPVIDKLGIHPIHYINVIIGAVGIGLFLPPIGLGMLIACSIAKIEIGSAARALAPFLIMLLIGLLIVILFPSITLILPEIAGLIR
jgi:tripartite ATP-independent transporter DctM subunit